MFLEKFFFLIIISIYFYLGNGGWWWHWHWWQPCRDLKRRPWIVINWINRKFFQCLGIYYVLDRAVAVMTMTAMKIDTYWEFTLHSFTFFASVFLILNFTSLNGMTDKILQMTKAEHKELSDCSLWHLEYGRIGIWT